MLESDTLSQIKNPKVNELISIIKYVFLIRNS